MNLQTNQSGSGQAQEAYMGLESLKTLSKDDIYAQTRFVSNFNSDDDEWMDNDDDFNGYIEEYE